MDEESIRKQLLWKLFRNGRFGKGHFSKNTVLKGLPKHARGKGKKILNDLVNEGLIDFKPHKHGGAYSLNIDARERWQPIIDLMVEDFMKF